MHRHLRFCRTGNPLYFASSKMNTKKLNYRTTQDFSSKHPDFDITFARIASLHV